jgi:hypothetical protein
MEDSFNKDPNNKEEPKTSSTDSKDNSKTTPDSQEQNGIGVANHDKKLYEKSEEQEEYIDNANNNTATGNDDPVQDGKGMTMCAGLSLMDEDDDDDDEDDEDDDDDDDGDAFEVGDDPSETKKKMPVM